MRTKLLRLTLGYQTLALLFVFPTLSHAEERIDVYYRPDRTPQGDRVIAHWTTTFPSSNSQAAFVYKYSTMAGSMEQTAAKTLTFHQDPKDEASPTTGVAFEAAFDLTPAKLSTLERLEIRANALSTATQATITADRVTVDVDGIRSYFANLDALEQVVINSYRHEAGVSAQIVDAVRIRSWHGWSWKVVDIDPLRRLCLSPLLAFVLDSCRGSPSSSCRPR